MSKVLVFGASNSKASINRKLAIYAASLLKEVSVNLLDLNDFEMPIYSIDREKQNGIPQLAIDFKKHIREADGILISFAEHNGAYTAAFKNIYDWVSRIEPDMWLGKPMLLMGTAPGGRGAQSVLEIAHGKFKRGNDQVLDYFSLPHFKDNFSEEKGVLDPKKEEELKRLIRSFEAILKG